MASPANPFRITLYNKAFGKLGTIGAPLNVTFTARHNQQPSGQIIIASTHPRSADLTTPGCRYVLEYRGLFLSSGVIRQWTYQGPTVTGTFTAQLTDDWWLLSRMLAWPVPGSAIGSQSGSEYDTRTGAAETVFKAFVTANKGHGNSAVSVATDLARGTSITIANRFHPLTDRLLPAVDTAGIGTTVQQVAGVLTVDCYASATYPRTLTEASGIVQKVTASADAPKATRVIVGGQGEGTARVFRQRTTSALETTYGFTVEAFKDATDAPLAADLDQRGDQFLAENIPTNGLAVDLSETSSFRYDPAGTNGVRVGDIVTLQVGPAVTVTDILREATLTWSTGAGLTVTPLVGEMKDDPNRTLARAITALARGYRTLQGR